MYFSWHREGTLRCDSSSSQPFLPITGSLRGSNRLAIVPLGKGKHKLISKERFLILHFTCSIMVWVMYFQGHGCFLELGGRGCK